MTQAIKSIIFISTLQLALVGCRDVVVRRDSFLASCNNEVRAGRVVLTSTYGPGVSVHHEMHVDGIDCVVTQARAVRPFLPEHIESPHISTDEAISMLRSWSYVIATNPLIANSELKHSNELLWLGFIGRDHYFAIQITGDRARLASVCGSISRLPAEHGVYLTLVGEKYKNSIIDCLVVISPRARDDFYYRTLLVPKGMTAEQCLHCITELAGHESGCK